MKQFHQAKAQKQDLVGYRPTRVLKAHKAPIYVAKFNKDGQYVMTGSQDRSAILWNPYKALQLKTYSGGHNYEILDLAMCDDNSKFVSCGGDKQAYLWEIESGKVVRKFGNHQTRINCICIGGETALVATGGYDCEINIWDLKDRKQYQPIQKIRECKDSVSQVQFDQHYLISSSVDGHVRYFDFRKGMLTEDYVGASVLNFSMSVDQRLLSLGCGDSKVRILERSTGQVLTALFGQHKCEHYNVGNQFSWDDSLIITGSEDGTLVMYDMVNGRWVLKEQQHSKSISSIDKSSLKNAFVTASYDGLALLWSELSL